MKNNRNKKLYIIFTTLVSVFILCLGAGFIYVSDYYRTDQKAIEAFAPINDVTTDLLDNNTIVFETDNPTKALIFYPGGKVEYSAYQPLMASLAQQGIMCFLVEMPFNLAVLDINAADGIQALYPEIEQWYIGGHSLGGSMAASYLQNHIDEYEGLILLGSYSTADFSNLNINVLSIYGSEDKVMNHVKYAENKTNLPSDMIEIVIEGGCHAYFGMYGPQEGDGNPTISNEEQIVITASHIASMMN